MLLRQKKKIMETQICDHTHIGTNYYDEDEWMKKVFNRVPFDCFRSKEMWALIFSTRHLDVLPPLFISINIVEFFPPFLPAEANARTLNTP
jgi:hypothetical protein